MAIFAFKLPDLGEGIIEAELVEWHMTVGDVVEEGDEFADIMTDKATVEVPSPVDGKLVNLIGEPGEMILVGSVIAEFEVEGDIDANVDEEAEKPAEATPVTAPKPTLEAPTSTMSHKTIHGSRGADEKSVASPAVRGRAKESGIDLRYVPSSGEAGRITHDDLDAFIASGGKIETASPAPAAAPVTPISVPEGGQPTKIIGLRRVIAEKLQIAKQQIPHITYVEEIDVTDVEDLRQQMNADRSTDQSKLTLLPFLMRALVTALKKYPKCNSIYDDVEGVVHQYEAVHIGVATQTDKGLMVPVVRGAEARDLWDNMNEMARVSTAAKEGSASRDELSGSTITISSLGRMGGVVSTPVINKPEVAIIGVNNMVERPVVKGGEIAIRKMMNLSSSFDHRIVDGYDAAELIQYIKGLLEDPSSLVEG